MTTVKGLSAPQASPRSLDERLLAELRAILGADCVTTDADECAYFSQDVYSVIDPVLFWPNELLETLRRSVQREHLKRLKGFQHNPETCEAVAPDSPSFGQSDPIPVSGEVLGPYVDWLAALIRVRGTEKPACTVPPLARENCRGLPSGHDAQSRRQPLPQSLGNDERPVSPPRTKTPPTRRSSRGPRA